MLVDVRPLIGRGFVIFPVMQGAKQPPLVKGWQTQASNAPLQISRWFSQRCNVAVCTGPLSNIFVLDIDPKSGGAASMGELIGQHGLLPDTLTVKTPSGGWHRYFRWPAGPPILNSRSMVGRGLDIRGHNGYVLAPPSYIVDSDGEVHEYAWTSDPRDAPIADAPDWLLKLARERQPAPATDAPTVIHSPRPLSDNDRHRRFGEGVLARVCRDVATAPNGKQEQTLWLGACTLGSAVGAGYLGAGRALSELVSAGMQMANHVPQNPWTYQQVHQKVLKGITSGMSYPWKKGPR